MTNRFKFMYKNAKKPYVLKTKCAKRHFGKNSIILIVKILFYCNIYNDN